VPVEMGAEVGVVRSRLHPTGLWEGSEMNEAREDE
jgi:hypothetical protein